jgi:hypothetical protein
LIITKIEKVLNNFNMPKVKVMLSMCLIKYHAIKTYVEMEIIAPPFLTSTLDGVASFTPRPLYLPGERTSGTHWIGRWVGLRACLDDVEKRKKYFVAGGTRTPIVLPK